MSETLVREAESFGLRIGYSGGFTTLKLPAIGDPDELDGIARRLSQKLDGMTSLAIARARAARSAQFIGCFAFITDQEITGIIEGFGGELATIRCISKDAQATMSAAVNNLLIVISEDGGVPKLHTSPVPMKEPTRELVERIESLGVCFQYSDGFFVARSKDGSGKTLEMIRELGAPARAKEGRESWMELPNLWPAHMVGIRKLAIARAREDSVKNFIGATAYADLDGVSMGLDPRGKIAGCGADGMLALTCDSEISHRPMTIRCDADRVLVVLEARRAEQFPGAGGYGRSGAGETRLAVCGAAAHGSCSAALELATRSLGVIRPSAPQAAQPIVGL